MYKVVDFIDSVSHKISDPWLNNEWLGWHAVLKWQNYICDLLDRHYV